MTETCTHELDLYFSGTVDDKMQEMEKLYCRHGRQLLEAQTVIDSLSLLKEYDTNLTGQMENMDLASLCSKCAGRQGGGCCSSYMEANSDAILLLINRLYGVDVRRRHKNSSECCFLGNTGCSLSIKPMFCLNYNCKHIQDQASKTEMNKLEQLAGRLLTEQTKLEAFILQRL